MKLNKVLLLLLISVFGPTAYGQYDGIEKGYYQFPIQPNQINYLSGSMGELRSSHFHAGLDIKTNGKEGLKVYAAADGYVSRVRVSSGGYGTALYVRHPNGTTTVYAHLQRLSPDLAEYVLKNQYRLERFEVNLFPKANEFRVEKGEVIAYSGNTGSSSGPHLHFEIRNEKQEVLDPLRLGFDEIKDQIAPIPQRIALKTMDIDARVNGQFGRFEFTLQRRANEYFIPDTIEVRGRIGVELWAHDKLDGAANRNGIPIVQLYDSTALIFSQDIDTVNFSDQRNIRVHTNYQAQKETRRRYNKLYQDDGNTLDFYEESDSNGLLNIQDTNIHPMFLSLVDSYGNERKVYFTLKGSIPTDYVQEEFRILKNPYHLDNTIQVFRPREDNDLENITVYFKGQSSVIGPAYSNPAYHVYLWDLRRGLADSLDFHSNKEQVLFDYLVTPEREHSYLEDRYSISFNKQSLFDTLYLKSSHIIDEEASQEYLEINEDYVPLKGSVTVEWAPSLPYDSLESYQVYQTFGSSGTSFVGGAWNDDKISFSTSSFGKFTLLKDEEKPTIRFRRVDKDLISFSVKDDLSGIQTFRATLDGEWLLMHYDGKRNLLWSERKDKSKPLTGNLILKVVDNAGNESIYNQKL